jgi:uncharacterized protein YprB with RNaseH-like and TPR domain
VSLAERLRSVLNAPVRPPLPAARPQPVHDPNEVARLIGGEWRDRGDARCLVVERRFDTAHRHGPEPLGALAEDLSRSAVEAPLLTAGAPARPPFLFFDLETTGLSGGAGTQAFLVGCGWFDRDGAFTTRQYVLVRYADERPLLRAFAADLTAAGALVSFNGKSFDAPMLETRYAFHRLEWRGSNLPHLDVLHPARRFWGSERSDGCSLGALEREVLGAGRVGDVSGFEIPARYFQFVRSGDPGPLASVLEHNRLDLVALAVLTARLLRLLRRGAGAAQTAGEALALGRTYARAGLDGRANEAYERALSLSSEARPGAMSPATYVEALRGLAVLARRGRRFEQAAAFWRSILEAPGCPATVAREAAEALAIHHEHRVRDLQTARTFALRGLDLFGTDGQATPTWTAAVRYRIARIERKMTTGAAEKSARLDWSG